MAKQKSYFRKKGDPYILLTGLGLILSLGMVFFIVAVILIKGLGFFWPGDLLEVKLKNNEAYLGQVWAAGSRYVTGEDGKQIRQAEIQIKMGNRDLYGRDFIWLDENRIAEREHPRYATTFERWEYGNFYGFIQKVRVGEEVFTGKPKERFRRAQKAHEIATEKKEKIKNLEDRLNELVAPLTRLQREISLVQIGHGAEDAQNEQRLAELQKKAENLQQEITPKYEELSGKLQALKQENQNIYLVVTTANNREKEIHLADVVRFFQPNRMSLWQKSGHYIAKVWEFVSADPRESNTEGGVFPAIFGTVMMVLLMSIAVVPFGVLAAIYLNEYARQGTIIRLIRLSVNNLAGVPSIVFGIFGLGFFIYVMGGTIDQLFFSDKLPEPTFGTGGILWASLTLALLTLPVVVVATEEGILAVPRANKEGALALGSTRWQMIRKIVLPNAMPGILTGLILAISRGAGEVAPLMITGVVKLAPSLPVDGSFPFLHLDRKFMHLGFHIYDVGFQSPNVEAAKPMVYTTALLLILIVVILNLMAIFLRNRLRKKYKTSAF